MTQTTQLSVERQFESNPTRVILLNSMASNARIWKATAAALGAHHEVVTLDYPGCGKSPVQKLLSIQDLTECVSAALATLPEKPSHLVGYSLGAWVAARLAAAPRTQLLSLCLLAPSPRTFPMGAALIDEWLALLESNGPEVMLRQLAFWTFSKWTFDASPGIAKIFADGTLKSIADVEVLRSQLRLARGCNEAPDFGKIAVRTLLVRGETDIFCPRFAAEIVAKEISGSKLIEIPRVAHGLLLESGEMLTKTVTEFTLGVG